VKSCCEVNVTRKIECETMFFLFDIGGKSVLYYVTSSFSD